MPKAVQANLAMILFSILIAGSFSLGSLALPYIDPLPLNSLRFIAAAIGLGIFVFGVQKNPIKLPKKPWRFAIIGALMAIYFVSMFIALTTTSTVSTSAVFTLLPLMTAFFGFLILRQRLTRLMGVSLGIAGVGSVWVIFRGDVNAILAFDVGQGELIYLFGCACYAIYAPLLRKFAGSESIALLSFFNVAATTIWITLVASPGLLAMDWMAMPPVVWWVIAYLAIFPTAGSFFLIQFASLHLPASKVTAYGYSVPILVIFYEGILGNGWVSWPVLVGALVTIFGLVILYLSAESKHPAG